MKVIKNTYLILSLVVLMLLRPSATGMWFGSVVVAGLFVTWLDTMNCVWQNNSELNREQKVRYGAIFVIMALVGLGLLVLIIVNLVKNIAWLNNALFLDEITLLALVLCISQKSFVAFLGKIIKNGKEWYKE